MFVFNLNVQINTGFFHFHTCLRACMYSRKEYTVYFASNTYMYMSLSKEKTGCFHWPLRIDCTSMYVTNVKNVRLGIPTDQNHFPSKFVPEMILPWAPSVKPIWYRIDLVLEVPNHLGYQFTMTVV